MTAAAEPALPPIAVPAEVCRDPDAAAEREWLETNGLGGWAMGTVSGESTRRYHGLLVAATKPPVGRFVLLSKLEETLLVNGRRFDLSTNRFPGVRHPEGFRLLSGFRIDRFPTWTWSVEGIVLERSLFMPHGENTVCVTWRLLEGKGPVGLEVRPLVAFRDAHALTRENAGLDGAVAVESGRVRIAPYPGLPALFVAHDGAAAVAGEWYRRFEYDEERRRGFDYREDLWHPFTLTFSLTDSPGAAGGEANVIASTSPRRAADVGALRRREAARREALVRAAPGDPFLRRLVLAADRFLVARGDLTTVIAGYPWFSDWGRDTMIALSGLTLSTGRPEVAREILLEFSRHVSEGMLPNRFPDAGEEPEYNTVDATLWFFEAARAYVAGTGDDALLKDGLFAVLAGIVERHERGTRYGIRVDADGLLSSGAEGEQLTWMDARVDGRVITPRRGKPVEIQALWFNALKTMEEFAGRLGDAGAASRFRRGAARARASFRRLFRNEREGGLLDVVGPEGPDASVRPNQLFAVALHHPLLTKAEGKGVLDVVERELLTPYGLRTLAPGDPSYRGRYEGSGAERDAAYHQGTVWPWLLGAYVAAFLRVNGSGPRSTARMRRALAPLRDFVLGPGLGQVPEIFDGDEPRRPRGCPAQAWSVGELLRAASLLAAD